MEVGKKFRSEIGEIFKLKGEPRKIKPPVLKDVTLGDLIPEV